MEGGPKGWCATEVCSWKASFSDSSSMYLSMLQMRTDLRRHPSWFCLAMCSLWSDMLSILDRWLL